MEATTDQIADLCTELYGLESGRQLSRRLLDTCQSYRSQIHVSSRVGNCTSPLPAQQPSALGFSEADILLIAYPDHLKSADRSPLRTLSDWCRDHFQNLIRHVTCLFVFIVDCLDLMRFVCSTVHILPFHPSTAYDGYAITDYMAVDPAFGSWEDMHKFRDNGFKLMFDLVLNHCSSSHPWFRHLIDQTTPGCDYFITKYGPEVPWLTSVLSDSENVVFQIWYCLHFVTVCRFVEPEILRFFGRHNNEMVPFLMCGPLTIMIWWI
jgi:hypothetical protein